MTLEELFCLVDDFCKVFLPQWHAHLLTQGQRHRNRPGRLTTSELITIFGSLIVSVE